MRVLRLPGVLPMTQEQMRELARNSLANLDYDEESSADSVYSDAFNMALDALVDKGIDNDTASVIAREVAMCVAQP